jgi:hypothetical protein
MPNLRVMIGQEAHDAVVQGKPVEFAVDVELAQLHGVARRSLERRRPSEGRVEVKLVETVHLRHVGHCDGAAGRKLVSQLARVVGLQNVNGIRGDIGRNMPLALIRRLRRCMDVHHEVPNGAPGAELDLGVAPAHARESIHTVDDDLVSGASDALHGNRVVAEARDETIPLFRPGRSACEGCQRGNEDGQGLE